MTDLLALYGSGNQGFHLGDALYGASVLMAMCIFVAGVLFDLLRKREIKVHEIPGPIVLIAGAGILLVLFQPYGWLVFSMLHAVLINVGRSGQAVMGVSLNVFAFIFFLCTLVPRRARNKTRF
jgi:uncharacterized membrane protein